MIESDNNEDVINITDDSFIDEEIKDKLDGQGVTINGGKKNYLIEFLNVNVPIKICLNKKYEYLELKGIIGYNLNVELGDCDKFKITDISLGCIDIKGSTIGNVFLSPGGYKGKARLTVKKSNIGDISLQNLCAGKVPVFEKVEFTKPPDFNLDKDARPRDIHFKDCKFIGRDEECYTGYRELKVYMSDIHNEIDESRFRYLEYETRLELMNFWSEDWFEVVMSWLSSVINKYGYSVVRPLYCLMGIFVIGWFISYLCDYYFVGEASSGSLIINKNDVEQWACWSKSLYVSFHNTFIPAKFILPNLIKTSSFWLNIFWVFQILFSTVLWYLLIMGVKRRYGHH